MQRNELLELTKKMTTFPAQLIKSFLLKKFPLGKENSYVSFKDFMQYLNENAFSITPELNISNKSDAALFSEFINPKVKIEICKVMQEIMQEHDNGYLYLILSEGVPLHYFSMVGSLNFVNMLIYRGADVNILSKSDGFPTSLHCATSAFGAECIQILIDAKASINIPSWWNATPLDSAVEENNENAVRKLLTNGAKIKKKPNFEKMLRRGEPPSKFIKAVNIEKLLNEASQYTLKDLKPTIVEKINESTHFKIPNVIIEMICSYEPRCSQQGYFRISNNKKEEQVLFEKDNQKCNIM